MVTFVLAPMDFDLAFIMEAPLHSQWWLTAVKNRNVLCNEKVHSGGNVFLNLLPNNCWWFDWISLGGEKLSTTAECWISSCGKMPHKLRLEQFYLCVCKNSATSLIWMKSLSSCGRWCQYCTEVVPKHSRLQQMNLKGMYYFSCLLLWFSGIKQLPAWKKILLNVAVL